MPIIPMQCPNCENYLTSIWKHTILVLVCLKCGYRKLHGRIVYYREAEDLGAGHKAADQGLSEDFGLDVLEQSTRTRMQEGPSRHYGGSGRGGALHRGEKERRETIAGSDTIPEGHRTARRSLRPRAVI